jgi:hypothetical protein
MNKIKNILVSKDKGDKDKKRPISRSKSKKRTKSSFMGMKTKETLLPSTPDKTPALNIEVIKNEAMTRVEARNESHDSRGQLFDSPKQLLSERSRSVSSLSSQSDKEMPTETGLVFDDADLKHQRSSSMG